MDMMAASREGQLSRCGRVVRHDAQDGKQVIETEEAFVGRTAAGAAPGAGPQFRPSRRTGARCLDASHPPPEPPVR